ncbi:hypothetical protein [Streptomyces prunicolor]|uniref:hypothetical protein n=1 Tax=Streptomyces prunicolor TaxID=67348 RepID=UPI000379C91F|nr:hypothetical protein [Streptomyces prunicolor]
MSEIAPNLSDDKRCVSVHWSIPAQCDLPRSHWEDHETTHPDTGVRLRYCRTMGTWRTEELRDGAWHRIEIPPPGGYCGQPDPDNPPAICAGQFGHRLSRAHAAYVDGVWRQWPSLVMEPERRPGLDEEALLRGLVYDQAAEIAELRASIAALQASMRSGTGDVRDGQQGEKDTSAAVAGAASTRPMPPGIADRLSRLRTHIENKCHPVTTSDVHHIYISWGWKGLGLSDARRDLAALAEAGHLTVDNSHTARRRYVPVRTARGGVVQ